MTPVSPTKKISNDLSFNLYFRMVRIKKKREKKQYEVLICCPKIDAATTCLETCLEACLEVCLETGLETLLRQD